MTTIERDELVGMIVDYDCGQNPPDRIEWIDIRQQAEKALNEKETESERIEQFIIDHSKPSSHK